MLKPSSYAVVLAAFGSAIFVPAVPSADEGTRGATVVVAGPSTGRYADRFSAMMLGARRATASHNVQIVELDDGCDAGRAEGAARMTISDNPDLVIGHPCPAAAIAAARVYAAAGVLFIALGVRHPDLTDKRAGPTIFRLAGRDDRQGVEAAHVLHALAPDGPIAIIQDRTAYARAISSAIAAELSVRKAPSPVIIPIVAGRRDYGTEIKRLKDTPPKAIFFAGYPAEAGVLLRSLRNAQVTAPFIASDANATEGFAAAAALAGETGSDVSVMVPAAGAGGLDEEGLEQAAADAVRAWRAARNSGDAVQELARGEAFDERGDARVASFRAAPLVNGQWANNAALGTDGAR
jgi:ABC-type branched-subunit amino acid transport system substrate-binding protein